MKLNRFLAGLALALCLSSITNAATLLPPGQQVFIDSNGHPLAGGSVSFYVPGTTTLKDTYQDANASVLNSNPILLDSAGRATIFGTGAYRQVVKDRLGNLIWDKLTYDTSGATSLWGGTSAGTANAQTVSAPNFTSQDGQSIAFIAGLTNTGPFTLNPSGAGPVSVLNDTPAGPVTLSGGEIVTGNVYRLYYVASTGTFHMSVAPAGVPAGTITAYGGQFPPSGYLICDGSAVSRTTYAKLFAAIGGSFGLGDGSTTFNIPDLRGRAPVGRDGGTGRLSSIPALANLGGVGGEQTHTLSIAELPIITPSGTVTVSYPAQTYGIPASAVGVQGGTGATVWSASTTPTSTTPPGNQTFTLSMNGFGSGQAHNVVQPSMALTFIIKY